MPQLPDNDTTNRITCFREGKRQMTYRKSFQEKRDGVMVQYAGLYDGNRLLSTGDLYEEDAKAICQLFNEGVLRRAALRRKTHE